jgi:thioredoxin-related protein
MKRSLIFLALSAAILAGCREKTQVLTPPVNLAAEVARANAEHKLVLLEFGSSDSCPPCVAFERKVFSQPEFIGYATSNLVFVRLDYPFRIELPPDTAATNDLLMKQFDVPGFPTFIALDSSGKEFWRMPAKDDPAPTIDTRLFTPQGFIGLIESVKGKRP